MSLNVFSSGAPASASEVNENFNYLKEEIGLRLGFKKIWEHTETTSSASATTHTFNVPTRPTFDFTNKLYHIRFSGFGPAAGFDRFIMFRDSFPTTGCSPRIIDADTNTTTELRRLNGFLFNANRGAFFIETRKVFWMDDVFQDLDDVFIIRFNTNREIPAGWKVEIFESEL
jgi:hypothetical protein